MTCQDADGQTWLVALDMASPGIRLQAQNWHSAGMRHAATYEIDFDHTPVWLIGPRSQYLQRPGFWHGGAGIAACWYGATTAVANVLRSKLDTAQPHASAHLGAMFIQLSAARAMLHALAARMDAAPQDKHLEHIYAVRAQVRDVATQVMERSARALGPAPLCMHAEHAQRCADWRICAADACAAWRVCCNCSSHCCWVCKYVCAAGSSNSLTNRSASHAMPKSRARKLSV